ncbi:autotransporter-associated beta strand repeat-containing protein, partial [Bosea sp. Root483D1]|uniref:autotransporter-associated beta strand repeat-containing protein n=1 Tax=Bosea sp. Root483D1 TaxID=1736544 RepID=UPI0039B90BA0
MVTGAIQGGNGGVRGSSNGIGGPGAHGPGGQGIVGSNLTIINSGTIEGGLSGDGTTRAAALHFTGGGNTLTFLNATTGVSGGIVIDSGALAFNQSTAITVGNVISGGGGVNKQGNGTLTLSGSNTYTGGTTLTAGKLVVSQNANLGAPSGNLNFNGGTLQVTSGFTTARTATLVFSSTIEVDAGQSFTMSGAIGGAGTLTKTGGGTLTLSGSNTYFGGTTISDGTVSVSSDANLGAASGGLTFNGASTLQVTGSFTTARATVLNANGAVEVTAGQNFTMGGAISGTGGVIKTGTGTLTLTGTNTYTGGTTISDGTVSISSDANLGNANTPITLNNATNVGGAGTGADAVLRTTATFSSSRNIAFTSSGGGRIETDAGTTLTLSGAITTGGSASFIKQGAGTLVLTGDSSANYAGRTWVNDGTLRIEGGGKLGSTTTGGQAYISNGATAIVTGLGSSWETFGAMRVGEHGSGTLRIENGGSVKTGGGSGTVGIVGGGGDSSVTITGAGSQWVGNGTQVYIGHSNAGTLTLSDGGKFELTGANSTLQAGLVGGTAGGTINIGAAEGSAAAAAGVLLVGTVALNTSASKIVFNHTSSSYSFAPTISGAGSVRQVAGTTILTGITTYSGATAVTGGTLRAGQAGSFSANSAFTLSSGTTLDLAGFNQTIGSLAGAGAVTLGAGTLTAGGNNTSTTFSGSITGAGGFTKAGSGTLMLSGTSTYSGATAVTGGTLRAGQADSFSASSAFTLSSGTTLDLDGFNQTIGSLGGAGAVTLGAGSLTAGGNNTSTIFSGSVTGTGGFTKTGSGTLMLSGTSTYSGATTIQQGRLYAANAGALSAASDYTIAGGAALEIVDAPGLIGVVGSIAGAGSIQIGTGATLKAGSSNASTSFSGKIEGNGGLTKAGTGTLRLSGTSTYTGATRVEAGKLVVNGSLASNVTLDGGTLGGSGTIGALAVASGGTVAPGNSIGTLNVSGNVAFAAGSTYQVEINAAGQSDRIVATGLATISGGTVAVLAETGNYAASTTYTILTATGGVTGRFTTATSNLVFLAPSLAYDSNNVILTMTRNATGFGPGAGTTFVASTRNQGFIANAAEALGAGNAVYDALLSGTAAEARAGFDMLSGEAHAQAVSVLIDESRLVRETILSHLRGPLLTAPGGQVAASFSADLPGRKGAVLMAAPLPQPRYSFWGEAFGGTGNTDADGNAASQSRRTGGALLGADLMLYEAPGSSLKLGVAGGYSQSRFDLDARRSSGKLESGHAALYAGARFGNLRLDAGVAYSWSESDIRRQVQVRGFGD